MRFGSVCSGIEAASVAWHPLGWEAAWLAEIEPFPCAVLAHHYPDVTNYGDMTKLAGRVLTGDIEAPDVFCGGTPCQAFSVAGLRNSLDDARGNLSLTFCEIANAIDTSRSFRGLPPSIIFWENVPGVLSTKDNAFGCFLAGLAGENEPLEPPGGKWTDAGYVHGPQRTIAWRTLDAQYFGLAQRRKRVFVVASSRAGFDPAAVLFEFDGVRRDSAPSRETGQGVAASTGAGTASRSWHADISSTLDTTFGTKHGLEDQHVNAGCPMFVPVTAPTLRGNRPGEGGMPNDASQLIPVVANTLKTLQGIQSPDTYNYVVTPVLAFDTTQVTSVANRSSPQYGDPCHPLATGAHAPAIAFNHYRTDASPGAIAPTLQVSKGGGAGGAAVAFALQHAQIGRKDEAGPQGKGWQEEVAFTQDSRACADAVAIAFTAGVDYENNGHTPDEPTGPLLKGSPTGGGRPLPAISLPNMQVRRLTPIECERLQGFPDNWTRIPYRNKPAELCPDGPRYKALGNSWAVPVVRWIGQRIQKAIQ